MWQLTDSRHALTCWAAVAAAFDFLFAVLAVEVIITGRTCVHCRGKTFLWAKGQSLIADGFFFLFKTTACIHQSNFVTGCWLERRTSGSWLCVMTAGAAAAGRLWSRQPREFSSSGNRKWSAPPDETTRFFFFLLWNASRLQFRCSANSPSFCQAGSLFWCERNSFRIAWGLWWSASVGVTKCSHQLRGINRY